MLTQLMIEVALDSMHDVFTPDGDAGVVTNHLDGQVFIETAAGNGSPSGWYSPADVEPGKDLKEATYQEWKVRGQMTPDELSR